MAHALHEPSHPQAALKALVSAPSRAAQLYLQAKDQLSELHKRISVAIADVGGVCPH